MLYQSNAQLLLIGRNINQIAKSLNTSSPTALSTQELKEIKAQIAQHTKQVGQLVSASFERMPRSDRTDKINLVPCIMLQKS